MGALGLHFFLRRPFRGALCSNRNSILRESARIWTKILNSDFCHSFGSKWNIFGISEEIFLFCNHFPLFMATVRKLWSHFVGVTRIFTLWIFFDFLPRLGEAQKSQKSRENTCEWMPFMPIWLWNKHGAPAHCASIFEKNWSPHKAPTYR